jgi:dTDP-glucose pyrophosphorylase/CBS domain-containing protein
MNDFRKHLIIKDANVKQALERLNILAMDGILFVADDEDRLIGSLTDGDIRRGLLSGFGLQNSVLDFIQKHPRFLKKGCFNINEVIEYRNKGFRIIPVVDSHNRIINVVNFRFHKSCLPLSVVIMAGGRGERLKPFTDSVPKPMLKVGDKPIIEHNIDQLIKYGINDIWITVRYLGEQIEHYFKNGSDKGVNINYIWENEPLGTIGAAAKVEPAEHDYLLLMNSDILTNINFEDFFLDFILKDAMLSVVTIPYQVVIPYAVLETKSERILSFKEKPTYTYYSNGGIYLMKKECLKLIPTDTFFHATDLIEKLIANGEKVSSYPLISYWLDIGKHEDYIKAQDDIKHLNIL